MAYSITQINHSSNSLRKNMAYSITPSLKTCRKLLSLAVAPKKADDSDHGVIITLSGTPMSASLPLKLKTPSLTMGFLRNIQCWLFLLIRRCPFGKILLLYGKNGEDEWTLNCRFLKDGHATMAMVKIFVKLDFTILTVGSDTSMKFYTLQIYI